MINSSKLIVDLLFDLVAEHQVLKQVEDELTSLRSEPVNL